MLDSAGKKCDLHIRAARIFVMQLEFLEIRRLVALCHNEGPSVTEEPILATAQTSRACIRRCVLKLDVFPAWRRTKG